MSRPASLLAAIVVLALEGVGAFGWAILMLVVISVLAGTVAPLVGPIIAAALAFGVACLIAAWGAWRGRSWSWPVGTVLQAVVLLATIVAALSGGWHPALLAAVALGAAGLVALLAPATRRSLSV